MKKTSSRKNEKPDSIHFVVERALDNAIDSVAKERLYGITEKRDGGFNASHCSTAVPLLWIAPRAALQPAWEIHDPMPQVRHPVLAHG
jgi:hypothetical protein